MTKLLVAGESPSDELRQYAYLSWDRKMSWPFRAFSYRLGQRLRDDGKSRLMFGIELASGASASVDYGSVSVQYADALSCCWRRSEWECCEEACH
ncbi:hypothetical protein CCM_03085 [Cordyceps militaris CM01]|uniref:Uncharacterized protein n=1 Tax=Cordyceps militaris (strain CM01) TaxID=983644 RepID=G3J8T1_CORMM|nr:uncharacterized protein CCM_03085 [Cordyceps militaris CM01]EGX94814.1 hypothetical protein CCM_03085 [Cordyceps militaris CM01]